MKYELLFKETLKELNADFEKVANNKIQNGVSEQTVGKITFDLNLKLIEKFKLK